MGDLAASPPAASGTESPETLLFLVEGMRCGGCSAAVSKVLNADPSVARAAVNLVTETAAMELARYGVTINALAPLLTQPACPAVTVSYVAHCLER